MPLSVNTVIVSELIRDEGMVLSAYRDSLGYLTIGVGRLIDSRRGGGITEQEAIYLLSNDIDRVKVELDIRLPWWTTLSNVRQRVLVNMAFNLGISGLLKFRNTLQAIQDGRYEDAAQGMLKSKWAGQVGDRALRLAKMMREG